MAVGRRMNDPRSIGNGMALQTWIALGSDDYAAGLNFADTSINVALTPLDRLLANNGRIVALVLLRQPEAVRMLRDYMDQCTVNDWRLALAYAEGFWAVALVLHGEISRGIHSMKQAILRRDQVDRRNAAWCRMLLCEIYLEIIAGTEKPPAKVLARNILTLVTVMLTAEKRIRALLEQARRTPELDPDGHHFGRSEMILGLLCKAKKKRALAVQHLTEAKRIEVSIWADAYAGADRRCLGGAWVIAASSNRFLKRLSHRRPL